MSRNPGALRPGSNMDRPNGASALAGSDFPPDLLAEVLYGNRASRRLAKRNLFKKARAGVKQGWHGLNGCKGDSRG